MEEVALVMETGGGGGTVEKKWSRVGMRMLWHLLPRGRGDDRGGVEIGGGDLMMATTRRLRQCRFSTSGKWRQSTLE